MRIKVIVPIIIAALIVLMGCTTEPAPMGGIIKLNSDFPVGQYAPDIPFTSTDGKETTFNQMRQSIAIVAFTTVSSEACCSSSPTLVDLASRLEDLPITVAQIHLPTSEYPYRQELMEHYSLSNEGIVTLYDAQHLAWRGFGRPNPNTVLLIDDYDRIVCMSKDLDNLKHLTYRARRLGEEAEKIHAEHFEN